MGKLVHIGNPLTSPRVRGNSIGDPRECMHPAYTAPRDSEGFVLSRDSRDSNSTMARSKAVLGCAQFPGNKFNMKFQECRQLSQAYRQQREGPDV